MSALPARCDNLGDNLFSDGQRVFGDLHVNAEHFDPASVFY